MIQRGRRERKKAATRGALVDAALVLFAEQGVDETSIEQITDRVDVSVRTFHRYFASKDDVLFADREERLAELRDALRSRSSEEPLLASLREAAAQVVTSLTGDPEREALRLATIESSDALRAVSLRATEEWARVVTEYAAERLGQSAGSALPRMLGSIVVIAVRHARRDWQADPTIDVVAAVRRNVDVLADLNAAVGEEARR